MINKLVRDSIPDIIVGEGLTPVVYHLTNDDLLKELFNKLHEETNEVLACQNDSKQVLEELVDVYEVICGLSKWIGYSINDVKAKADFKRKLKGGFDKGIYLIDIKQKENK